MDDSNAQLRPPYNRDDLLASNPTAGAGHPAAGGMNITLDPTGMVVKKLPASDSTPLYYLNKTLLHVNTGTSIHVKRAEGGAGEDSSLEVWALGEHYMAPLHTHKKLLRDILVARSHGLLVWAHIRKIAWDFSTRVPLKEGEGMHGVDVGGVVHQIGASPGPGTKRKNLLQMFDAQWVCYEPNEDGEVIALEREGGAECANMPVLSIQKELDQDMLDFLVSAWLVTLWGEVGARVHRKEHKAQHGVVG